MLPSTGTDDTHWTEWWIENAVGRRVSAYMICDKPDAMLDWATHWPAGCTLWSREVRREPAQQHERKARASW